MKTLIRVFVSAVAIVATHLFVYWVPFSLIFSSGHLRWIRFSGSLLCAILMGLHTWRHTASILSAGLVSYMVLGAIVTGGIGFLLGFFGPMILTPEANQGPLFGIFITGPLGSMIGAIGGGVYWSLNRRA